LSTRFEEIFDSDPAQVLTPAWIQAYAVRRPTHSAIPVLERPHPPYPVQTVQPREVQQLALRELDRLRQDGESKALVVAATGLGKTFLAAFDAREADRVLFIAHREELLHQAEAAFERVYPARFMHVPELQRMGAEIDLEGATAIIKGGRPLSGAPVMASDLRASAALILAGLAASGETWVQRLYHLDRGYVAFERRLAELGADIVRLPASELPSGMGED
jgi:hypothetical protein